MTEETLYCLRVRPVVRDMLESEGRRRNLSAAALAQRLFEMAYAAKCAPTGDAAFDASVGGKALDQTPAFDIESARVRSELHRVQSALGAAGQRLSELEHALERESLRLQIMEERLGRAQADFMALQAQVFSPAAPLPERRERLRRLAQRLTPQQCADLLERQESAAIRDYLHRGMHPTLVARMLDLDVRIVETFTSPSASVATG